MISVGMARNICFLSLLFYGTKRNYHQKNTIEKITDNDIQLYGDYMFRISIYEIIHIGPDIVTNCTIYDIK